MSPYRYLLNKFLRRTFGFWQVLGFHITPVHYYQPLPNTRELKPELWTKKSELAGLNINDAGQLKFLAEISRKFKKEYAKLPLRKTGVSSEYYINNGTFESVDGEMLYSVIRNFQPQKVWEIGSGFSTLISAQALLKNKEMGGPKGELFAFEPYPVKTLKQGFLGLTRLVQKKVQDVPLSQFQKLEANDILFIDSSHVLKIGSDVQYEYLEILPRLNQGVIVHIHDIFWPLEYPRPWVMKEHRFWNEQYLAQAFLAFNDSWEILWCGSWMHVNHPDKLTSAFPSYDRYKVWPGSLWLRKRI